MKFLDDVSIDGDLVINGSLATKNVKATEFDYLKGVKSAIQTQIDTANTNITNLGNKLNAQIAIVNPSSASAHNGIFRGVDLLGTGHFANVAAICAKIKDGSFDDIYIGDYFDVKITVSGVQQTVRLVIAGLDTYWYNGDTALTSHHAVVVPADILGKGYMNSTNITTGGYKSSYMRTTTLPLYQTAFENALGANLLKRRVLITNSVSTTVQSGGYSGWTGASNGWEWADSKIDLMSEANVYGGPVFGSSGYDTGEANQQFPLFALAPIYKIAGAYKGSRNWYWLRAVTSSTHFAYVTNNGGAGTTSASNAGGGIRPSLLIG